MFSNLAPGVIVTTFWILLLENTIFSNYFREVQEFFIFFTRNGSNVTIISGNALRHRSKSVKFVKFGICAPGPQSAPRCTETATFAKGFFQSPNLRKMLTWLTKSFITFSSNCVSLSKGIPTTVFRQRYSDKSIPTKVFRQEYSDRRYSNKVFRQRYCDKSIPTGSVLTRYSDKGIPTKVFRQRYS